MGIFKAGNDLKEIFYYLKSDRTIFIEVLSDGSTTFQVVNQPTPKSYLDDSGWNFEPISNTEFEEVLQNVTGLIRLGKVNTSKESETLDRMDFLEV